VLFKFAKELLDIVIGINIGNIFNGIDKDNIKNKITKYVILTRIEQFIAMIKQSSILFACESTLTDDSTQISTLVNSELFIELSNELNKQNDIEIKQIFDRLDAINLELKNYNLKSQKQYFWTPLQKKRKFKVINLKMKKKNIYLK